MDATEIIARVSDAKTQRDLPELVKDLENVDLRLLFDTLFPYAVKRQGINNGLVAFSAYVIHAINPPCPITPSVALSEMVRHEWDISIEEVPWYLANQFGADEVLACVACALDNQPDDSARTRLKSVRYWIGLNPKTA
ncbi:MAG: hypothetical protein KDA88_03205 [Planctomycetaceae bacterium]|nr:hypothetical protein [Planctomycetaceae bacterium]MCB9951219.1 hypothetical protein [Planctomycetaceae bacterium]